MDQSKKCIHILNTKLKLVDRDYRDDEQSKKRKKKCKKPPKT